MDIVDVSKIDYSESFLGNSVYSQSSQLLNSRLTTDDMQKMQKQNLLYKLLQLYQALQNTQKDNQLLRIQKAQLANQLKNCKLKTQKFIQSNIINPQSINTFNSNTNSYTGIHTNHNTPTQSMQNCIMTPYQSQSQNEEKINKVFVKTHRRGISNNCINQQKQNYISQHKHYTTLMNSPTKTHIKVQIKKPMEKSNSYNKITIPQNKLNQLIVMERQYEQKDSQQRYQQQNQTLQNFESFYFHKNQNFKQTQRKLPFSNLMNKKTIQMKKYPWNDQDYQERQSDYDKSTQRGMNKSMSSSNLSNQKYCNSRGFKIPNSIQQIWGTSNRRLQSNIVDKNNAMNNKFSKLMKVNMSKNTNLQRKSYLNS